MATPSLSIKLFIDTKSKKVLFAEAGKDFVDFLFNLMALPVGTVTRLHTKDLMVGSLGNLYDSIETISENYLTKKQQTKEALLKPKLPLGSISKVPLLQNYASMASGKVYFCGNTEYTHYHYFTDDPNMLCPHYSRCKSKMSREMSYIVPSQSGDNTSSEEHGFVKGIFTYIVTDDLVVKPISSFTLLTNFSIEQIGKLQQKEVQLDLAQGVKLLEASMQSKTVLTSVFLPDSNVKSDTNSSDPKMRRSKRTKAK